MRLKAGLILCALLLVTGCKTSWMFIPSGQQHTIDRAVVDYPPNFDLKEFAQNLDCPGSFCFDPDGTMFIVEGGIGDEPLHIFGRRPDGSIIEIYPRGVRVPFVNKPFKIYGPVGGIAANSGKLFVSHRDINDMGVITAFNYDGTHLTVVSEFPAQGDYGITDIAIRPGDGRIFFGVGPATNSGVVGLDNASEGWLKKHPNTCDVSPVDQKLYGLSFRSNNALGGFFGAGGTAVTAPFQPFNTNDKLRIPKAPDGKANSAVYSVSPSGGDYVLESYGIRLPRGLGFTETARFPYVTNDGMEMRGSRPIKNDPDAFIRLAQEGFFGFPDYSTDLNPVSDEKYWPPSSLLVHGFPEVTLLVDLKNSNPPTGLALVSREDFVKGVFAPMSGAAKFDFVPESTSLLPYKRFRGQAIVALSGDRAPFATSGMPVPGGPAGYKVVSVMVDDPSHKVSDFVYNVRGIPASKIGHGMVALERPCDVKMSPDGSLYILDMGALTVKDGKVHVSPRTGRIFKLTPIIEPERPTTQMTK